MPIDFVADLVLDARDNVVRGDRAESFAGFAGFECESDTQFADAAGQLFSLVQFARFAFGALRSSRLSSWRMLAGVTS